MLPCLASIPCALKFSPDLRDARYLDAIAGALCVLHHHDGVGAFGQRRARHYFHRSSGAYGAAENFSRAHFADHTVVRRERPPRGRRTRREPSVGTEDNRGRR